MKLDPTSGRSRTILVVGLVLAAFAILTVRTEQANRSVESLNHRVAELERDRVVSAEERGTFPCKLLSDGIMTNNSVQFKTPFVVPPTVTITGFDSRGLEEYLHQYQLRLPHNSELNALQQKERENVVREWIGYFRIEGLSSDGFTFNKIGGQRTLEDTTIHWHARGIVLASSSGR